MAAMAPGVSAALITTVAGLLVAIPSMFGYNWLVHNLRAFTVDLDNFAQELVSRMETEFLRRNELDGHRIVDKWIMVRRALLPSIQNPSSVHPWLDA